MEQKKPTVWSKTQKKPSIIDENLDIDDSDDDQQDNDAVFVKKANSPLASPHKHSLAESNHAEALNDEVLPKTLQEFKPETLTTLTTLDYQNLLWGIAKTNIPKPKSKRKPVGDGKLVDATSLQKIQAKKLNEIKLDSEFDAVLPKILEEFKPDTEFDYQNFFQKPMSKRKPDGDGKLPHTTSPQKIQVNKLNEIKLDSDLNAGKQQNALKENDPVRVSLSDSSDSDVEEVLPVFSTMSSAMKDLERKSRNWLLELDSQYNKVQETVDKINDACRDVSVITSTVNSDQNLVHSPRAENTETSGVLLPKLGIAKYNIKQSQNKPEAPQRQETLNDSRRTSNFTPKGNGKRNGPRSSSPDTIKAWLAELDAKFPTPKPPEKRHGVQPTVTQSSKPHITEDWLSKLESKYKTDQLKSQETLINTVLETEVITKVNTELDNTKEWLESLETEYFASPQITQENSNASHISNIVPKLNDERNNVFTLESKYEKVLPKTQDQHDGAVLESDMPKKNSETNEARLYLPAAALDWLSKLDAEYETASNKQEDLNTARQVLYNASKVNVKSSEHDSEKSNSIDHCLGEQQSRCNAEQHIMRQQEPNTTQESETVPKVSIEKVEPRSHILDTARQRLSTLKSKTEQSKTQIIRDDQEATNLSNVNKGRNEPRSFKFNTSEDLMMKLGFLYNSSSEQKHEQRKCVDFDLPALTPEQEKMVEDGLEPEPADELLVEKFNMRIHRRDLRTLADEIWLNDEVINFYMNLIMQRSEERKDLPQVYATNTFFYPKLMLSGQAGLRRWTRKVDIFAYDLFVVPINIGRHWCLSLVDFRTRIVKYLDSQGHPNRECLEALMQYLKDEHQDKKGAPFDSSGWEIVCLTEDIPQQMNGSDCGMFACTFAEFSSRDAAYSFTQAHMPYLRRKAALEILTGKLLL